MRELRVREATVDASAPAPGPALRAATPAAARTRLTRSVTCSLSQSRSWTAASHSEERLMLSWVMLVSPGLDLTTVTACEDHSTLTLTTAESGQMCSKHRFVCWVATSKIVDTSSKISEQIFKTNQQTQWFWMMGLLQTLDRLSNVSPSLY